MLSLRTVPRRDEKPSATVLCAEAHGFSLHVGVRCGEHQRKALERLCRYITRPAIAIERLKRDGAGDVVLQLKSAWRDLLQAPFVRADCPIPPISLSHPNFMVPMTLDFKSSPTGC